MSSDPILPEEQEALRMQLAEAQETLRAIRSGEVDALVISGPYGEKVYTLKGAEEPYRIMIETMTEAAVTFSLDGTILYGNARFAELVKMPLERTIGARLSSFVAESEHAGIRELVELTRKGVVRLEMDLLASDGTRIPAHWSACALRLEAVEVVAAVVTDLSEVARLQELDRLKSMFIASMSHELRTPLHSIIGFTGFLLQGIAGPLNDEQRKQLGIVKKSADHLLSLINDIIDITKIETANIDLTFVPVDIAELVREVANSFAMSAAGKGLAFDVSSPARLEIRTDRKRARQALANLVDNAVKFTERGGIRITLAPDEDGALVTVADTGIGIPGKELPKLFLPFSQIRNDGRATEGSGLGLYLTRKVLGLIGGRISVDSVPGKGSVFALWLPATSPERSQ